jgi:hypothetical protein
MGPGPTPGSATSRTGSRQPVRLVGPGPLIPPPCKAGQKVYPGSRQTPDHAPQLCCWPARHSPLHRGVAPLAYASTLAPAPITPASLPSGGVVGASYWGLPPTYYWGRAAPRVCSTVRSSAVPPPRSLLGGVRQPYFAVRLARLRTLWGWQAEWFGFWMVKSASLMGGGG